MPGMTPWEHPAHTRLRSVRAGPVATDSPARPVRCARCRQMADDDDRWTHPMSAVRHVRPSHRGPSVPARAGQGSPRPSKAKPQPKPHQFYIMDIGAVANGSHLDCRQPARWATKPRVYPRFSDSESLSEGPYRFWLNWLKLGVPSRFLPPDVSERSLTYLS